MPLSPIILNCFVLRLWISNGARPWITSEIKSTKVMIQSGQHYHHTYYYLRYYLRNSTTSVLCPEGSNFASIRIASNGGPARNICASNNISSTQDILQPTDMIMASSSTQQCPPGTGWCTELFHVPGQRHALNRGRGEGRVPHFRHSLVSMQYFREHRIQIKAEDAEFNYTLHMSMG